MSPRVSFTGATGYVALVRNLQRAKILRVNYPNTTCVISDLDSCDILMAKPAEADLILHCADAEHEAGTLALLKRIRLKGE